MVETPTPSSAAALVMLTTSSPWPAGVTFLRGAAGVPWAWRRSAARVLVNASPVPVGRPWRGGPPAGVGASGGSARRGTRAAAEGRGGGPGDGDAAAGTSFPVDGQRRGPGLPVGGDGDLRDHGADQLLAFAGRGGRRVEDCPDVGPGC